MKAVWNDTGSVAYLSGMEAAVKMDVTKKPTTPIAKPEYLNEMGEITPWGSDNLFPQHVISDVRKSTLIPSTILKQAHMLQSSGMIYGKVTGFDKEGREQMEYVYDPQVEDWLKRTNIRRYLREASLSYHWFYNLFPEMILSKDRKKIVSLQSQRPENCRWAKQNDKTGFVDHCYISASWELMGGTMEKKYVTKVPTIDPYYDAAGRLLNGDKFKYIYPLSYPSPGTTFYQLSPWNGLRDSGWLEVSLSVPAFKKALFQNQITVKYMIEVSTWWWNWQHPGFDDFSSEKKKKIMDEELTIDPYYDAAGRLLNGDKFKYIYPLSYPSPGTTFYQLSPWNGLRDSGWLEVSLSVPAFKKALFQNQITVKYMIEVSTWWWNWQHPGFDDFSSEKKKKIMDEELTNFENFIKGKEHAGKAIMTTYQSDPQYQKQYDGWKITAIDDKIKDGIYIEDSQEAASHLLYALGWDPTLTGPIPGRNGMGAGSGSDKRVASEIYLSMIEPHRDVVLEPIQFAFDYNWPEKRYKVKFRNSRITPLSEGDGLKKEAA